MWSLTHTYRSKEELDEVMKSLQAFLSAINAKESDGVKTGKESFAKYLSSKDDTIKGFAALVLGITGDTAYAPSIARMLDVEDESLANEFAYPPVTFRGQAAIALSIIGTREYTPKIVKMLKSKNQYDRRGAITALGYLGAKEYAKEVVSILTDKRLKTDDDPSPIYFLNQNGIANNYKKEFVDVISDEFRSETAKAALYELVALGAKEYAPDIAKLLDRRFRKGDAAKALALLNASEYEDRIALLLSDENSLVRKDSALALGILRSKKHAPNLARLLNSEEDFVRYYAAISLVVIGASEYYKEAIPIIEETHKQGAYLNEGDFHPIVAEKAKQLIDNFKELLRNAKP
jgi:HEAT repeat protein